MLNRGIELFNQEKFDEAEEIFRKIVQKRSVEKDYRTALYYMGFVLCYKEAFEEAKDVYEELLEIAKVEHDMENSAIMYHQLSMVERLSGHLDKAIDYLMIEKNTRKCYLKEDYVGFSSNYYELGLLHLRKKEIDKAKSYIDLAIMNGIISEDASSIGSCYKGLGDIEVVEGNAAKAKKWYEDSKRYLENAHDDFGVKKIQSIIDKL